MEIIIWFICAVGAATIAGAKGRSAFGWFWLGILFGPFAVLVAVLPSREAQDKREARIYGSAGDFRLCPVCAEAIRKAAQKCHYCQSAVGVPSSEAAAHVGEETGAHRRALPSALP